MSAKTLTRSRVKALRTSTARKVCPDSLETHPEFNGFVSCYNCGRADQTGYGLFTVTPAGGSRIEDDRCGPADGDAAPHCLDCALLWTAQGAETERILTYSQMDTLTEWAAAGIGAN